MDPLAVFRQIHRISRVMLYETAISLQLTSFRSDAEVGRATGKINSLLLLMGDYAAKQEQYLFAVLAEYEPSVVDAFRQKHATAHTLMEELAAAAEDLPRLSEAFQRVKAGRRLEILYTRFLRFQTKLMAEKEDVLQPLLHRYCQASFLRSLQQELIQHDDCHLSLLQAGWIIKALTENDLVAWLKTLEKKATPSCMQLLLAATEEQMESSRFDAITEALTEGVLLG